MEVPGVETVAYLEAETLLDLLSFGKPSGIPLTRTRTRTRTLTRTRTRTQGGRGPRLGHSLEHDAYARRGDADALRSLIDSD